MKLTLEHTKEQKKTLDELIRKLKQHQKDISKNKSFNNVGKVENEEVINDLVEDISHHEVIQNISNFKSEIFGSVHGTLSSIESHYQNLVNFSTESQSKQDKENEIKEIQRHIDSIVEHYGNVFSYKTSFNKAKEESQEILKEVENIRTQVKAKNEQIDSLLKASQETAQKKGVESEHKIFISESEKHNTASMKWLMGSVGFMVTIAGLLIYFYFSTNGREATSLVYLFKISSPKIILISLLAYGLFKSVGNYLAHRHNSVVNQHRSNALKTFQTFVESSSSQAVKDAVLLQATSCIFNHRDTGYLKTQSYKGNLLENNQFRFLRDIEGRKD